MPLGGGNFTFQNKVLPGAYMNFISTKNGVRVGSRGIVSLPVELPFGEDEKIIRMDARDFNKDSLKVFGYYANAPELLLIREAFKRAETALIYKVNQGGERAKATTGGLTCTAKYTGTRGNDLIVAVLENPDGDFDVVTYLDYEEMDRQTVAAATDILDNDFITFKGTELSPAVGTKLTGGTDGEVDGASYVKYLAAVEVENFNTLCYMGTDSDTKALFTAFVKRLRDDEGYKVTCVLENNKADYEGIISVKNGVVLKSGMALKPEQAVAWVAGATAGAEMNESLTNAPYEGAVDVFPKYTKGQYEQIIKEGGFVFYADGGKAKVVQDINSLTTFAQGKTEDWNSNRLIRVLDGWGNDVARIFGESYIGLETNNDTGRQLFKADLVSLASQYEKVGAISDFLAHDISVSQGLGKRDVYAESRLKPNDSMEKLYLVNHIV